MVGNAGAPGRLRRHQRQRHQRHLAGRQAPDHHQAGQLRRVLLNFRRPTHLTCEGDSGGPGVHDHRRANEVIAGITSFGDQGCTQVGADTRVDVYADSFVQPYIDMFDPPPPRHDAPAPTGSSPARWARPAATTRLRRRTTCAHQRRHRLLHRHLRSDEQTDSCPMGTHCGDHRQPTLLRARLARRRLLHRRRRDAPRLGARCCCSCAGAARAGRPPPPQLILDHTALRTPLARRCAGMPHACPPVGFLL